MSAQVLQWAGSTGHTPLPQISSFYRIPLPSNRYPLKFFDAYSAKNVANLVFSPIPPPSVRRIPGLVRRSPAMGRVNRAYPPTSNLVFLSYYIHVRPVLADNPPFCLGFMSGGFALGRQGGIAASVRAINRRGFAGLCCPSCLSLKPVPPLSVMGWAWIAVAPASRCLAR